MGLNFFSTYYRSYPMGTILQCNMSLLTITVVNLLICSYRSVLKFTLGAQKNSLCIPKTCLVEKIRKKRSPTLMREIKALTTVSAELSRPLDMRAYKNTDLLIYVTLMASSYIIYLE